MKKMLSKLSRKIRRSNDDRRVNHFEKLEERQLMSFSAHINFAPSGAAGYSGYINDTGATYASRNGLTYGWNSSNSANMRDRNSSKSKDQRYDSLAQMSSSSSWGIAVPNGTYSVHIVSGDASYTDSAYKIAAEGQTVVSGTPTSTNHWVEGTKSVTVSDGKLTITTAGGSNNKIDFIDITQSSTSTSSSSSTSTVASPPAAPTSLSLSSASSTSIKLSWKDNSTRETGYKVYRSTDGSSFSLLTTLGANTTTYTNSGLTSGKKYYYKVTAYNSYGNSAYTNTASLTSGSSSSSTSSGSSSSPSGVADAGFLKGINIGEGDNASSKIPVLRDLGVESVRIWMGLTSWSNRWTAANTFANARAYKAAGFKVTLLTTCTKVPTYSEAKAYFDWAVGQVGSAVDYWEIGNEPNISSYFSGSLTQYVQQELHGAYDALHAHGEKVIGAGVTASRSANQAMKDAGYLNYVDYANIHPYDTSVAGQEKTITDIKAMFAGKPLVATEWNFQLSSSNTSWSSMLKTIYPFIQQNLSMAYYFNYNVMSTPAGFGGVINSDGSKHQPFYDTFKSMIA